MIYTRNVFIIVRYFQNMYYTVCIMTYIGHEDARQLAYKYFTKNENETGNCKCKNKINMEFYKARIMLINI
jgi:hypothetical protein